MRPDGGKELAEDCRMVLWQALIALAIWYFIAEFPFSKLHFVYELY